VIESAARRMQFPIGARTAGAKAVAEPASDNEIAGSLAVTQLQFQTYCCLATDDVEGQKRVATSVGFHRQALQP
jgi:hypothetical protein